MEELQGKECEHCTCGEKMDFAESMYLLRAQCIIEGMKAANKINEQNGEPLTYSGAAFFEQAEAVESFMLDYAKAKAKAEKDYLHRMKRHSTHNRDNA